MSESIPTASNNSPREFFKKYKLQLWAGLLALLTLTLATAALLINKNSPTQSITTNSVSSSQITSLFMSQSSAEELTLIPDNVCADSLQFGNPSYAYIGAKKYIFGEPQRVWIEANCPNVKKNISTAVPVNVDGVIWSYDMPDWIAPANAPACPEPLQFPSPADLSLATSILYPGQVRGTDYKTHGGLRFDNLPGNSVNVKMPADAYLWRASKYDQDGEVQFLIEFMSKCGIVYKFDHLRTLSSKLSEISNMPTTRTTAEGVTYSSPTLFLQKGEVIATEVGFKKTRNVGFDFGVFDLRQKNKISQQDSSYISKHMDDAETASNAICWLDHLEGNDKNVARALPVISVDATKESDYCD